ncbi:MAG: GGDEF domain-containing protein [Proteobacteria bacterium]|nr:GGDEF domain-containing protein [Desulfobulbaceae bacterium]MBU4151948.1 GGDEF domain-containing protein [Pseudomonadota bacterium]
MQKSITIERIMASAGILGGNYSEGLKDRVRQRLDTLQEISRINPPVIPYLCAWKYDDRVIWYEFADDGFCELLRCDRHSLANILRGAIIDRRVYRYTDKDQKVEEKIITRDELRGSWQGLRNEVETSGEVEAIYKVRISDDKHIWLKDQATIEHFDDDGICLSLGFLTDVSKEMDLKDLFEKIGYIDELTRLPKRSILDRMIEVNIGNFQRSNIDDFVLMMIDVDHFKKVNDTYGHLAGDYILVSLAEVMTATTRKQDEIGRYGGEEFYGFTIGDISLGLKFAERLRKQVEKARFVYQGQVIPITVSIGLVSATQLGEAKSLSADQLVFTADKRLYAAKHQGRNRVVFE